VHRRSRSTESVRSTPTCAALPAAEPQVLGATATTIIEATAALLRWPTVHFGYRTFGFRGDGELCFDR